MKSKILKTSGILISLGSAIFGAYWILEFARSTSPDKAIFVAPLFFCGLPLTIIGNIFGFIFSFSSKSSSASMEMWLYALPIIICYFIQWQFIGLWLYRKAYA